ncbi:fimbrial biogenesis chaperone [Phyllobacterium lublinensis]|jgi:fimbrial chaperone protein|uniref:fimbrial biogenesis chaperone n=1 Tax=Phyllobacterium lublinensis TaxID=2875708 RepID=UPI001CCBF804|nr:molecular chaperone [Phyllobacterium sp. 2063]MBZ9653490.1 molecular chaperone [Phyllobacterium sp. 2063]
MRSLLYGMGLFVLCALQTSIAGASSLQISPTRLDKVLPEAAGVITLRNGNTRPVQIQVRVFRWSQVMGIERFDPTTDVVASPPVAKVGANNQYVLRVVRVSKRPAATEESYRVLVDELPDPTQMKAGNVNFTVRFSMPVFFRDAATPPARVNWRIRRGNGGYLLSGTNTGSTKLRLKSVQLLQNGRNIAIKNDIAGHVIAGGTAQFQLGSAKGLASGPALLKLETDNGPLEANVDVGN